MPLYATNIFDRFQKSFQGLIISFLTIFLILNSNRNKVLSILYIHANIYRIFGTGYTFKVLIHKKSIIFRIIIPGHINSKSVIGETIFAVKKYPLEKKNCFIIQTGESMCFLTGSSCYKRTSIYFRSTPFCHIF